MPTSFKLISKAFLNWYQMKLGIYNIPKITPELFDRFNEEEVWWLILD
jgi:hypothetical protein